MAGDESKEDIVVAKMETVDVDVLMKENAALRDQLAELQKECEGLRKENKGLREHHETCKTFQNLMASSDFYEALRSSPTCLTVEVPEKFQSYFKTAERTVADFFQNIAVNPMQGTLTVGDNRYILLRGSALTVDFVRIVRQILGDSEPLQFVRNLLHDLAHTIGQSDAKNYISITKVTDPIEKLSSGPVHFSFTGWAKVKILPESTPSTDPETYCLVYEHPYSFEADAYLNDSEYLEKMKTSTNLEPVCTMNCGYSSGWCGESFGMKLASAEILCKARGDPVCRFIMAHPSYLARFVKRYQKNHPELKIYMATEMLGFFEKRTQEFQKIREELSDLSSQYSLLQKVG